MIGFILNLPFTVAGILVGIISGLKFSTVEFRSKPIAIILRASRFWWARGYMKKARAMTIGHIVLLGPTVEVGDLEHELVHVEQYQRFPIFHPFLYQIELWRKGYRNNRYEVEAYQRAGNMYRGEEKFKN